MSKPFVILIAGASGAGKTTISNHLADNLNATIISMDNYFVTPSEDPFTYNWDRPDVYHMDLLINNIEDLLAGKTTSAPKHDYATSTTAMNAIILEPSPTFIIVEGLMVLTNDRLRALADHRVFVECELDLILARKLIRDTSIRGYDLISIINRYETFTKPGYLNYVLPSKKYADVVIKNDVAVTNVKKYKNHYVDILVNYYAGINNRSISNHSINNH